MTGHLRIVGDRRDDRLRAIAAHTGKALVVRCHQRLRGPYTGVDTVLRAVLPEAYRRWPDLVEDHRVLLFVIADAIHVLKPRPRGA